METPASVTLRLVIAIAFGLLWVSPSSAKDYVRDSEPKLLSYDELVQLGLHQQMIPELAEKLRLIPTPFINNETYLSGVRPQPLDS
jgi:hypothetical protein